MCLYLCTSFDNTILDLTSIPFTTLRPPAVVSGNQKLQDFNFRSNTVS
jgi:hypothetical protein